MSQSKVQQGGSLSGNVAVPGDKSISHRALLLGALAEGASHITGFLRSVDCLATLNCLRALGVEIENSGSTELTVHGRGPHGFQQPAVPLDCVRSGTTMRLLTGLLAGQSFASTLTGAPQLLRRPMRRVVEPLRRMGAKIEDTDGHGPLMLEGGRLRGVTHELPVPSAQVKSALLLAGLTAAGPTTIHQAGPARDHTERMLAAMGAEVQSENLSVTLNPTLRLSPISFRIPGDISSAAFLLVAGMLVPGSQVSVSRVGVNPTRTGLLDVLRAMGGELAIENRRSECGEPVADIKVRYSRLHGITIEGDMVVRMVDEFPILAVAATQAQGTLVVRDAQELRVKETDRIGGIVKELHDLGAHIEEKRDGFVVEGPTPLHSGVVQSHGDHRLAMSLIVAGLIACDEVIVQDVDCIEDSFPGFLEQMREIGANLV